MAVKNNTILGKIYQSGTNDYQQRVPNPTQATIAQTVEALFAPNNARIYNEFMSAFVNLFGMQKVHDSIWKQPLAVFKGGMLEYGSTIQESAVKWVKAHSYDDEAADLLAVNRPEAQVWYHTMNRQDQYPITVNRMELQMAFRDEYGLNRLINSIMSAPINSDNYDEYRIMLQLIAEYQTRWGFFKHNLSAMPTDEATGKEFLTALRTYAGRLTFPSAQYNAAGIDIPVFARPDELVLFITPEVDASLSVNTLASVFNVELADVNYRKILVDELPLPNAVALLTTNAFYVAHDIVYTTTHFNNPQRMDDNYWLQHWSTLSVSPFVPAILFTVNEETSVIPTVTQTVTTLQLAAEAQTVEPGSTVQLTPTLNGTLDPDTYHGLLEIAPDSCLWTLSAKTAEGVPVNLNTRTYVDRMGVLHVQKSGLSANDVITVAAESTYINPSGATEAPKASIDITVSIASDADAPAMQSLDDAPAMQSLDDAPISPEVTE